MITATIDETTGADHLPGLQPQHLRRLRESGLTDATIKAAGLHSETSPDAAASQLGWRKPTKGLVPAIVIPFANGYNRLRPDTPRKSKGRPVKYESPRDRPNQVYFPPNVPNVLTDPAIGLAITEGEFKALAVTQDGPPCLGLVGVYGWKDRKHERLLPELERIAWSGRKVTIIFDSDIDRKPDVQAAEARLAKVLADHGAIVSCVRLPDGPDDAAGQPTKMGADDFLVSHGPAEFQKLLTQAIEPPAVEGAEGKDRAENIEPATMGEVFLKTRQSDEVPHLRFHRGSWWLWISGRYVELDSSEVKSELVRTINRDYSHLTVGITSNVLLQVQAQSALPSRIEPPAWIEKPPVSWPAHEVMAMRDELIHIPSLVSGQNYSTPATPLFFNHNALDFSFSPDPPKPERWFNFLHQLWGDDKESIQALQQWMGYLLTPDTRLQKIFMLIGPPRSGKGTIARVIEGLIGRPNIAGPTLASFGSNFGLSPLLGKTLAIIADARLGGKSDQTTIVERLLSISGEDTLTADRKFREPVTGKIGARLMIVSNELPRLAEASGALAGRMVVLRLTNTFMGQENTALTDELLTERPSILLWAIEGWQRLREQGKLTQPKSGKELADELKDLSSPVGEFLHEHCEVGPRFSSPVDDVYRKWREWCEASGRSYFGTRQTFGRDLRAVVPSLKVSQPREDGGRVRTYEGIRLLS